MSTTTEGGDSMNLFLERITFPQLTDDQIALLEAPLTTDEITEALSSFARSKSLGSDGLPIEFYNYAFESFELPPSMREAIIILIPKQVKDAGQPASYHPFSLLLVDIKILAKVLALHLNQVILTLVHSDQAGFMPGRNTSCNLRRLYINLQALHEGVVHGW